jgi:uridylate kinase
MKVVVALGGSVISPENSSFLKTVADLIARAEEEYDMYVVVGGGSTARKYIQAARPFSADERYLDGIGIAVTRLNARLFNVFFKNTVPETIDDALNLPTPVIMGGTVPGQSTDAVAAALAGRLRAERLVIATNVDGVYDRDPKHHADAKKLETVTIAALKKMAGGPWKNAGASTVVDSIACAIIEREKIPTIVVNGLQVEQLENAIYGKKVKGTVIAI